MMAKCRAAEVKSCDKMSINIIIIDIKVKRPLLARFFNNLTETTCLKERVVGFFFAETINTVV